MTMLLVINLHRGKKNNLTENKDSENYIISHKLVSDGVEVTIKRMEKMAIILPMINIF